MMMSTILVSVPATRQHYNVFWREVPLLIRTCWCSTLFFDKERQNKN